MSNPNPNSNPNPSNNREDDEDNSIPHIPIEEPLNDVQIPRIAPEGVEGVDQNESYSVEDHTQAPTTDWILANTANQPRPFNKEVLGLRGDTIYVGRIAKVEGNKLYMIINGSANTAPRVIDFWTDIPDNLKVGRKIGATQGIVTWLKSPQEMLVLRDIWHLVQMNVSSKIDLSRSRILQIEPIEDNQVKIIVSRSYEPIVVNKDEKVIAVASIRTLRRRELNVLAVHLGPDFHEDTKHIKV